MIILTILRVIFEINNFYGRIFFFENSDNFIYIGEGSLTIGYFGNIFLNKYEKYKIFIYTFFSL
jgi:hypothetical protein